MVGVMHGHHFIQIITFVLNVIHLYPSGTHLDLHKSFYQPYKWNRKQVLMYIEGLVLKPPYKFVWAYGEQRTLMVHHVVGKGLSRRNRLSAHKYKQWLSSNNVWPTKVYNYYVCKYMALMQQKQSDVSLIL